MALQGFGTERRDNQQYASSGPPQGNNAAQGDAPQLLQVRERLKRLDTELDRMEHTAVRLDERLQGCLRPAKCDGPPQGGIQPDPDLCPLAISLMGMQYRVEVTAERLSNLLDRLEV